MLAAELSLDGLQTYQGRNPCPADFDAYWAEALDELAAVDPQLQIERIEHASVVAECFDLTFQGVSDARVYAKYLRPVHSTEARHPGIAVFHGYGISSPDWFALLPYVAQGYSVAALDCRGQGGRSQDMGGAVGIALNGHLVGGLSGTPRDLLYRQNYLDCVELARILGDMDEVDHMRIGVTGISQGGGLSLACAALLPEVRAVAVAYPFLCDFLRVWEMDLAENAYAELRTYLRRFDPTHKHVDQMFERLGYIDVQHLASRIQAQVLMATALRDAVCPPSTQFAAYNRIKNAEMLLYPDYEHERLPGFDDRVLKFFSQLL